MWREQSCEVQSKKTQTTTFTEKTNSAGPNLLMSGNLLGVKIGSNMSLDHAIEVAKIASRKLENKVTIHLYKAQICPKLKYLKDHSSKRQTKFDKKNYIVDNSFHLCYCS